MDSNYIAFVEKPDYSDDDIEQDLAALRNEKRNQDGAVTEQKTIKNKGKKN